MLRSSHRGKRAVFAGGALGLAAVLTAAAALVAPRRAATATVRVPDEGELVAEVAAASPAVTAARARAAAGDRGAAVALARSWIDLGRRRADPRYLGRAQAALAPWWHDPEAPDD